MTSYELPQKSRPGVETRQVLLTLGAVCLVVAFTAGTALVWSRLGPAGQLSLMAALTCALLIGAATVRRLPATAEALAAVGLAGCIVDAIAARTLHVSAAEHLPLHSYIALAALGVATAAATLGAVNRRLVSAPLVWSTAPLIALVAAVDPTTLGRAALLTPLGIVGATAMDQLLRRTHSAELPVRAAAQALGGIVASVGYLASLVAATQHDPAGVWGATLPIALLALPVLLADRSLVTNLTSAALAGVTSSALVATTLPETGADTRALMAVALLVGAVYAQLVEGGPWIRRCQLAAAALAYPGVLAFAAVAAETQRFATVAFVLAVASAGVAATWPLSRDGAAAVRNVALGIAALLASIGTGITLGLHGVTTPEAYVATPSALTLAWGSALLFRDRQMSSAVLLPGIGIGLLPTFVMSLGDDHGRQAVALVAATVLVVVGAELRLGAPLFAGTAMIAVLSLRLVGPQLATMPKWVVFGAAGAVLLTLGATWEARLADIHRFRRSLHPRIEALR